jgi:hypothetical protein
VCGVGGALKNAGGRAVLVREDKEEGKVLFWWASTGTRGALGSRGLESDGSPGDQNHFP